jgi:tRNA-dihydrouridine synthase
MWHACRFKWADDGHAKSRVEVDGWLYDTQSGERPLIAQLCAVSADEFIYAAKQLEPFVDGIDLNCRFKAVKPRVFNQIAL